MFKTSAVSHILGAIALATILVGSTAGYLILQPAGNEPIGAGESWFTVITLTANYFSHTTSTTKSENPATIYVGGTVSTSIYRSCYRFDLTSLPASSTVTQVRIKLKITANGGPFANWDIHAYNSNGQTNPSADTGATQWSRDASGNLYNGNDWIWYNTGETWIILGGNAKTDVQNAKTAGTIFVVSVHECGDDSESPSADGVTTKPQLEITYTPGWSYRKSHVISSATGAGTNYQVKIVVWRSTGTDSGENVYVGTKCRTDFGDVRFTASNGVTFLDYWMENCTINTNAIFWVEVADSLESAQTIYIYYGQADAVTTSNIVNTGIFGDDIENGMGWTKYGGGTGGTLTADATVYRNKGDGVAGHSLHIYQYADTIAAYRPFSAQTAKCSIIWYIRSSEWQSSKITGLQDYSWGVIYFQVAMGKSSDTTFHYYDSAGFHALSGFNSGQWYKIELIVDIAADKCIELLIDGVSQCTNKAFKTVLASLNQYVFRVNGNNQNEYVDDFFVRKYVSPEPAHSTWGSEETPNSPPYAPTPSSPAAGYHFNPSSSVTFSWTFSDPDAGDYQTAYQFQLDDNNDFSSPITNPGKVLSWIYRKSHVINPATGAGVDYQVKLVVHYGSGTDSGADVYLNSHCRADFGDVRFTASDGTTQLSYWIESKTDSSQATFWVKISDDLSTTARTIYLYYGNSGVSTTSNGINTFLFFDDFADSNYADSWTTNGATWSEASGILSMAYASGLGAIYTKNYNVGHGIAVESKIKPDSGYRIALTTGRTDSSFHVEYVYDASTWGIAACNDAGTLWTSWVAGAGTTLVSGTWYTFKVLILPNNNVYLYCNDVLQLSYAQTSEYIGSIGFRHWYSGTTNFDDMRVRKYISSEPAHGNWGSEEQQSTCLQTLPSTVGIYYWRVKTWDSSNAEGPYSTGRTIFVDRIKIVAGGINSVVDTRTGGAVWYTAVYEYDSTAFTGSVGTLSLNSTTMVWATDRWTYAFPYQMSGSQTTFHVSGFTETTYNLNTLNNAAGDLVLNWATMTITINKP